MNDDNPSMEMNLGIPVYAGLVQNTRNSKIRIAKLINDHLRISGQQEI